MAICETYIGKTKKDFQVGQVVWFKPSDSRHQAARVTKVGRKWVYFRPISYTYQEDERFDPTEISYMNFGWPSDSEYGIVFAEEEHILAMQEQEKLQAKLKTAFLYGCRFPLQKLRIVAKVLDLDTTTFYEDFEAEVLFAKEQCHHSI